MESKGDEAVMYIIVNSDLKMDKGKIASQCCHSTCRVTRIIENMNTKPVEYNIWINNHEPKIVLKASQEELEDYIKLYGLNGLNDLSDLKTKNIWCVHTRDLGRTQIEKGSLTSMVFCPILRKNTPDYIKKLKLL